MTDGRITVVIPSIPPRAEVLKRALKSVSAQTIGQDRIDTAVEVDELRRGAAATRHDGLLKANTEWVAFLDDDDTFMPAHLEKLLECAEATGADYVYSWYEVIGGTDPMPDNFGKPFDAENPVQTTVTTLVRTEVAQSVGYFNQQYDDVATPDGNTAGEDWRFTLGCLNAGAKIVHLPERTWHWWHWNGNTSGLPSRW